MLVLSRKENESVVIDGDIKVTVLEIKRGKIRLGIEAPQAVPICRSELLESEPKSAVIGPVIMPKTAAFATLAELCATPSA